MAGFATRGETRMMDREVSAREARSDEAGLLLDLLRSAFREYQGRLDPPTGVQSETMASVMDKLRAGGAQVCEVSGTVVGCVFCTPKADHLYVGRLAVAPEYRRRGIGDMLMRASERRAGELGFARVRPGVRVALEELRAYYEARGYVPIAFHSHPGHTEPTSVEMEKTLEQRAAN
jgi:ribosomal protein S18 acetylase RimI-like enzyme